MTTIFSLSAQVVSIGPSAEQLAGDFGVGAAGGKTKDLDDQRTGKGCAVEQ